MLREQLSSRGSTAEDAADQYSFSTFEMMEELMDKLKVLNYDKEFLKDLKMRPLNK